MLQDADAQQPRDDQTDSAIEGVLKHMRSVTRIVQTQSRLFEQKFGVSSAQLWSLFALAENPGCRVSDFSKSLSIHNSTASNLLDKLERKGLLERRRTGPDHRIVSLYLTEQGERLLQEAPHPSQGPIYDAMLNLPEDKVMQLEADLSGLVDEMHRQQEIQN